MNFKESKRKEKESRDCYRAELVPTEIEIGLDSSTEKNLQIDLEAQRFDQEDKAPTHQLLNLE